VDAARRLGADVVIAVDISGGVADAVPETTLDTIFQSVNVMYAKIAAAQLSRADVVIHPMVGYIASGDFTKRHEAILEGEKAAQAALPKIRALLGEPVK
jgi:NTE family protein